MTTSRFDPEVGKIYGVCNDCGFEAPTEAHSREHIDETLAVSPQRRSHSINIRNPERTWRIYRFVEEICRRAIDAAFEEIDEAVLDGDLTDEEVQKALISVEEFNDAWQERETEDM